MPLPDLNLTYRLRELYLSLLTKIYLPFVWGTQMFEFGNVRFRAIERTDLSLLHEWENDPELMLLSRNRTMTFASNAQLEKQYEDWTKDETTHRFLLETIAPKEAIGEARIEKQENWNIKSADVGIYVSNRELWGRGLGKQIVVALLEIAFVHLNTERCEAWSVEYNGRAHTVLESCGFKKGGALRQTVFVNGRKWDMFHFDVLREEYLTSRVALIKEVLGVKSIEYMARLQSI
jgi:RimJ/RimL family protein N-acetyltransferase